MRRVAAMILAIAVGAAPSARFALADEAKNYIVTIDGTDYGVDLGESLQVKGADGKDLTVALRQNAIGTFRGQYVSFQHIKEFNVTSTKIDADIVQHMMATNRGSLMLVQEYSSIDPRTLSALMISQMAKDDLRDGGQLVQKPGKRQIANGKSLSGLTATVNHPNGKADHSVAYEVMTDGTADHGLLAVTRIDDEAPAEDRESIERFWQTMAVKY